ncbi:MAG: galactose-1-phosphate uridylyltransferase [Candidatus Omnitrophica bacterium]|nr:galactose-1-phosphate uridylyltransferase [Candidatus Omnitrophota bacterium]
MPELRRDPVTGRWVIIATERARRPGNFFDQQSNTFDEDQECPFCASQEQEIYAVRDESGAWQVMVVPSGTPLLHDSKKFKRRGHGMYDIINDYGVHEVVIETPTHTANMADLEIPQIQRVFDAYIARSQALAKNTKFQYVLMYKNYGWAAGSRRIGHARSQIIATAVIPANVQEKFSGAKKYFEYHDRCIYCDIVRQEIETQKRVVVETEHFVAVAPFAPRFAFELWIIPKNHHCYFSKGVVGYQEDLAKILKEVLLRVKIGLDDPAYNYVIQTAPLHKTKKDNRWLTLEEDFHWHIEVMPRITKTAGFEKGSGFHICSLPPEDIAEYLREVEIECLS